MLFRYRIIYALMKDPGKDKELLKRVRKGDLSAYESLFHDYYVMLSIIAKSFVKNNELAEELVNDVFVKIWERREFFLINTSLRAYLAKSVQNRCINYLRQNRKKTNLREPLTENMNYEMLRWSDDYPLDKLMEKELADDIEKSVAKLPERCRQIFLLSRDKGLQYDQIAENLNISVNTVKAQMKIALSKLREYLREYL